MSINAAHEDSVLVSLSTTAPDNITFPERRILLTESQPKVHIGRSSNRTTLGLLPTLSNGWIDSPVVKIRDAGSMHGTFLNSEKVGSAEARLLVDGDKITFGMPVYRNQTIFKPATMTVGIEFRNAARANSSPSRVFTVPDDCSTDENFDENEPTDDDIPLRSSFTMCHLDTPQETNQNIASDIEMRQTDGATEIESASAPNDLISISSDDDDDENGAHDDDDDESISLTDDEQTSSEPASPVESVEFDDTIQIGDDGPRSPSWNRVSTDSESEHMDEDSHANRPLSDDEQGVFLYDSADSDEMDEVDDVDPIDNDFDPSTQPSHFIPMAPSSECAAPVLPSLSAAVFSQQQYPEMPFGYQLPPVGRSIARQPSPSDAVLPLSHRHHGSEDDNTMAAENLGRKWGKPDFFEAREHNKITISRLTEPTPSLEASLVPDAATKASNVISGDNCLCSGSTDLVDHITSSSTETSNPTYLEPTQGISQEADSEQNASQVEKHAPQGSQASELTRNPWLLVSGVEFSKSPLSDASAMDLAPAHVAEALDWTPASAYELHQYKQQVQARKEQETEACRNHIDIPFATDSSAGLPKDSSKGKRKAAEISETIEQELAWHDNSDSMSPIAPSSPVMQSEPDLSLPSPPTTPQGRDRADARPSKKIRKIAERVGYAALGGATVGAMVFTSLIYTAPSFA
ncbi:hypothetical protein VSDG_06986 [Cytospora chrysosperma]|uniref:FHA domain-containing protein n=1 Tax=Cytospora chrysosperma TaxID=252740 RepID=A0A423VRS4_CYTCH|nr:hypothetical protein VSDG_06986 [Valsa sordida]